MITRIDHIGVAVQDLEESLKLYRDILGIEVSKIKEFEGMKIAFLPVGDSEIEILQDITPNGAIANFIAKKGQGIQHLALAVDDIKEALKAATEKGLALIDKEPRIGAGGYPIAFLHPKSTQGVLLELCQEVRKQE